MSSSNIKIVAFVISLKRFKKNSVVKKKPKYKMAQQLHLHPNTFNKYLIEAKKLGYITDHGDHYKVISFRDIIVDLNAETGMVFNMHGILKSKNTNYKQILTKFEKLLVIDNIYTRQKRAIEAKAEKIDLFRKLKRTDKSPVFLGCQRKAIRLIRHLGGSIERVVDINKKLNYNPHVMTSARHTGKVLGISTKKANRLLSNLPGYDRVIEVKWVKGCSLALFDSLKEQYPRATIYPLLSINRIKICFGSQIKEKVSS